MGERIRVNLVIGACSERLRVIPKSFNPRFRIPTTIFYSSQHVSCTRLYCIL